MDFKYAWITVTHPKNWADWAVAIATFWSVLCLILVIVQPIIDKNILPQDKLLQFFIIIGPLFALLVIGLFEIIICQLLIFLCFVAICIISPDKFMKNWREQMVLWRQRHTKIMKEIREDRCKRCQNTTRE